VGGLIRLPWKKREIDPLLLKRYLIEGVFGILIKKRSKKKGVAIFPVLLKFQETSDGESLEQRKRGTRCLKA